MRSRHWIAVVAVVLALPAVACHARQVAAPPAKPAAPAKPAPAGPLDAVTPVPRDAKWMQRHDLINSRAVPGEVDLLFIGDSITQGWEGAGKDAWARHFAHRKPMNAGIGGDRTQHVLWRLDNGNIKGIAPKVAVLMIGTNNSQANTSAQIADGIKAIVAKLRSALPETKILLLAIFPRGPNADDARRKTTAGANELVKSLHDGKQVFYLDLAPKFLAADGTLDKAIMPDLLHLSPRGYEIWAEGIEPTLAGLLGEK